jgi:K319L-like, PKD domain
MISDFPRLMSEIRRLFLAIGILLLATREGEAERINQEGRILGPAPQVSRPTLFNTPQADAVVSAMQIMPVTNPWNEDVSQRPRLANSDAMIAQIKSDLSPTRQNLRAFYEMNYVLVPDNQPRLSIPFLDYPDESDLDGGTFPNGNYPIPPNMPIESWPKGTGTLSLSQWQLDVNNSGGDRHGIMVAPGSGSFWETWQMKLTQSGWQASNGAKFNLNSNSLRPAGWTSGDAAGLPMFPAVPRFDECERGMVEHAMRLAVAKTRREYIYPAVHYASSIPASSTNYPAMGQRLRLKASFVIPSNWTVEEKAILLGLKKYGAIVADNSGGFFSISVAPDDRWPAGCFDHLASISIDNFEVIQTTGPTEGPRSPGAPTVDAGPDQVIGIDDTATLRAVISAPNGGTTVNWRPYSGPALVQLTNSNTATANASFTAPGSYTFMVSVTDNIHVVAHDAVIINVMPHVRMANVSTRAAVGTTQSVAIAGFIINGDSPKRVMVRALGPSLTPFGVAGALADPMLDLRDGAGNQIATNDNWRDSQEQAITDTGLAPGNDSEAAIVATLSPGNFTAIVNGRDNTTGIGLLEVYELDSTSRLLNISTRGFVGGGDNMMIAGLILNGTDNGTICFRALGPSLAAFGVHGVIADPRVDLFNAQGIKIGANNNWKDSQQGAIQSAGLAPGSDSESALLTNLAPGNYTAIVSGVSSATGVALVEAYHLP